MTMRSLQLVAIDIRLTLMRLGWTNSIACLISAVGILAWLWAVPHLRTQMTAQQQVLAKAKEMLDSANAEPPVSPRPVAEQRLASFYDSLGEGRYAEQQIKTLFAIAKKANLIISQAEYRWDSDKNGRYQTYQILLPVKGSYGAIRQFCEQTLLTIPFASLDEMNFKREAIANSTLEAKLRITLYFFDKSPTVIQQNVKS